ncbi:MAG: hypothetical protein ACLQBB_01290 [Solirubrobacteraceae bacterium]
MSAESPRGAAAICRRSLVTVAIVALAAWLAPAAGAARGGGAAGASTAAAAGPSVTAMIVGAGNVILYGPRTISASARSVKVGARSCGVAAGTPLAVLADLHVIGGPAFALRDYGHCTSSAGGSGELFVYSIDGETNHGQDGWEYKVGNLSGSTGAGDPSGAQGNGRLLGSGQQVLWFWCGAFAGGCQRNLEASAPRVAVRGGRLNVRVTGYENEGRGAPMSGAVVRLGASSATTGSSGRATLRVPSAAGSYALTATRPGSVPSFPETIQVR